MKKDITALFCFVDDFCKTVDQWLQARLLPDDSFDTPTRTPELTISEIMTIILLYHQWTCKNFKYFYKSYLQLYAKDFSILLSYNRFIEIKKRPMVYLTFLLQWYCEQAHNTGLSYVDATPIAVCHPKRISRNKVFAGLAQMGCQLQEKKYHELQKKTYQFP